jgi:CubicO group peptidase (beta-lactamase class C family)
MIQKIILTIWIIFLAWSGLQAQNKAKGKIEKEFQKILKQADVHNGFLQIKSADETIDWTFVGGSFQDGTEVNEAHPFHAASVGKMFTATVIMKLVEDGKLKLEDSIAEHLPAEIVTGLHIYEGKDHSLSITIAQLLQHTSGLPDYIMDTPEDGSPNMITLLLEQPDRFWTIKELLAFSKEKLRARFLPGEGYYYTDTEYLLLGLIIEAIHQKELHQVFAEVFFAPLQMENTAMFKRSEAIAGQARMAEFYVDQTDISTYESLSMDWAGGGLVTTTEDLLRFHQALFSGEIIGTATLEKMQDWREESQGTYYGLGLRQFVFKEFSKLLPKLTIVGHSGVNAAFSFYCPELEVYIAGTFNQTNQMEQAIRFLIETLVTIKFGK